MRKTTRKGGGWIVFSKTSFLHSEELLSGSESEIVQSLSEFRVLIQRINVREQRKKEHKQLYRFLPQTGSSSVPLALPRRVPLKCNLKLQVAQSHKKETSQCSRTTPRDFYAQSHLKETSFAQGQLQETSFAQSLLEETYLNNYKELNKVLNTWYTIRGIHNTLRHRTDSVFLDT